MKFFRVQVNILNLSLAEKILHEAILFETRYSHVQKYVYV